MYSIRLDTLTKQTGLRVKVRVKVRVVAYVFYLAGYLNTSDRVHSEG